MQVKTLTPEGVERIIAWSREHNKHACPPTGAVLGEALTLLEGWRCPEVEGPRYEMAWHQTKRRRTVYYRFQLSDVVWSD